MVAPRTMGRSGVRRAGRRGDPAHGRITTVADVFDALTHKRPYKEAWALDEAIAEISRQRGDQFDPRVVDAFMAVHDEVVALATAAQLG